MKQNKNKEAIQPTRITPDTLMRCIRVSHSFTCESFNKYSFTICNEFHSWGGGEGMAIKNKTDKALFGWLNREGLQAKFWKEKNARIQEQASQRQTIQKLGLPS